MHWIKNMEQNLKVNRIFRRRCFTGKIGKLEDSKNKEVQLQWTPCFKTKE